MAEIKPIEMRHEIDDLVITCMDHRFHGPIREFLQDKFDMNIDRMDRLTEAGSSKKVVSGELIPSIQTSYKLHKIKNVWVFDHTDCGGFGGLEAYEFDENKEAEDHFKSLARAQEAIHKVLPQLMVKTFVIGLHGEEIKPGVDPRIAPSRQRHN